MRLGDLDALKEDLRQYFSDGVLDGVSARVTFNQILHDIDNAPTVFPICEDKACKYRANERPQDRWIPVSERLPEERGIYLVTEKVFAIDDRNHRGKFKIKTEQVGFYDGKWDRAYFFEVIAWQPLPEPYKEGGEE